MGQALDVLGWAPDTFWRATAHEYIAAVENNNRRFDPDGVRSDDAWDGFASEMKQAGFL